MKRKLTPVRDVESIESELIQSKVGLLAYNNDQEKINQYLVSYLYENKNIYIFFDENDESYENLIPESLVSFSIFREIHLREEKSAAMAFKVFHVKCSGILKKVDEIRLVEETGRHFMEKYSGGKSTPEPDLSGRRLIMIDTEEIQAYEITGGI